MPKYQIYYNFNGRGQVEVEAENEKKASELFFEGQFDNQKEIAESDFDITDIELISE